MAIAGCREQTIHTEAKKKKNALLHPGAHHKEFPQPPASTGWDFGPVKISVLGRQEEEGRPLLFPLWWWEQVYWMRCLKTKGNAVSDPGCFREASISSQRNGRPCHHDNVTKSSSCSPIVLTLSLQPSPFSCRSVLASGDVGQMQGCLPLWALTVCSFTSIYLMVNCPRPAAQVLLAHEPRRLLVIIIVTAFFHNPVMCNSALYQLCDLGQISQPLWSSVSLS